MVTRHCSSSNGQCRLKDFGVYGSYSSLIPHNEVERWKRTVVFAVAFSFLGIAEFVWVIVVPLPGYQSCCECVRLHSEEQLCYTLHIIPSKRRAPQVVGGRAYYLSAYILVTVSVLESELCLIDDICWSLPLTGLGLLPVLRSL
jgi:hypothetical protein